MIRIIIVHLSLLEAELRTIIHPLHVSYMLVAIVHHLEVSLPDSIDRNIHLT